MQEFFKPKSVAIIGASEKKGKIGNILVKNAKSKIKKQNSEKGTLKIFPVNPKEKEIEGLKVYTSVLEINEKVDLAVIAIPAKFVNKIIRECIEKKQPIKNIIIISAGFGEAGGEGKKRKEKLEELIAKYKINILGPNCLGVINASDSLNLSFAKKEIRKGSVGLISQSGAFITAMIDIAEKEQFGFSLISSLGNKINLNENDLLEYYWQDENTKIIALYLESISVGREFQKKLKKITKVKPVIIIKAGMTDRTKQAIQSHTGSMAGEASVAKEAIKNAGGILVDNLEEFVDLVKILNNFKKLQNKKLVVVTNAGGPGVITTDLIEKYNLKLFEFNETEKELLRNKLPAESSLDNPIDLLGDALEDRYQNTLEILIKIKGIGGVLVLATPQSQTPIKKIVEAIITLSEKANFPIFPVVIGGEASSTAEKICNEEGINNFQFPVKLLKPLAIIREVQKKKKDFLGSIIKEKETINKQGKSENLLRKTTLLSYKESEKIGRKYELNVLPANYPQNLKELDKSIKKLGLPLVMKIDSPNIIHKNVHNGVIVGLETIEDVHQAFGNFRENFLGEPILVQHQVEAGLEIILGLKKDASFGLVLIIGLGGIITEILDEKILFVGKVTKRIIRNKLTNSKLLKIIRKEKISEEDLVNQTMNLFRLGAENKDVQEIDINPMFFYKDKEPIIVDFKILK